ncbi:MAG: hypothetical protein JWL70_2675 [Acidimicrobiia bacterium]|nr:hypothetical protein [Acidimicrobiia bacterium]
MIRAVDAGCSSTCVKCDQQVKFSAKVKRHQVICNIYTDGKWDRVEHFHYECYVEHESPYGVVDPNAVPPPRRVQQLQAANASSAA